MNDARVGCIAEGREDLRNTFTHVMGIEDQRRITSDLTLESPQDLLDVLTRFRDKRAADPSDKICGLLGLLS